MCCEQSQNFLCSLEAKPFLETTVDGLGHYKCSHSSSGTKTKHYKYVGLDFFRELFAAAAKKKSSQFSSLFINLTNIVLRHLDFILKKMATTERPLFIVVII